MLQFVLGLILGSIFTFVVMAVISANDPNDNKNIPVPGKQAERDTETDE